MPAIPAIVFAAAALLCSFVGRALLVNTAFGVSTRWGFTVLFVPFGPLFFRLSYRELAYPTRYWRLATGPLLLLFFLNGGTSASLHSLTDIKALWKPASKPGVIKAGDTHFPLPVPGQVVAAEREHTEPAAEPGATSFTPPKPAAVAAPGPTATPTRAVAAAAAAMAVAPKILNTAERLEANRREFERLAEWYDNLRHERGYLRNGDSAAVEAFNIEAAKYQAALQIAQSEQTELAKLTAAK